VRDLIQVLNDHADASHAAWKEAYMRHLFPFLGIRQPIRKRIQAPFMTSLPKEAVLQLWDLSEREFQYTAMDLLSAKGCAEEDLSLLERLITTRSWWDTVDVLSANHAGMYFRTFPLRKNTLLTWVHSPNLWLRRASLLVQLRYKARTDKSLLFTLCRTCSSEKEPFIQRAIGWALREYGKTNPKAVRAFLDSEHLLPLAYREAGQYLEGCKRIRCAT
jgi:3-methyladenine DNA glycosylase AlkD